MGSLGKPGLVRRRSALISAVFILGVSILFPPMAVVVNSQICMSEKEREDLASVVKSMATVLTTAEEAKTLSAALRKENEKIKRDFVQLQDELKHVKRLVSSSSSSSHDGKFRNERSTPDSDNEEQEEDLAKTAANASDSNQHSKATSSGWKKEVADVETRISVLEAVSRKILPQTCSDYRNMGVVQAGYYLVDPDGPGVGEPPIQAFCDFSRSKGTTVIVHDVVGTVPIGQCNDPGCFSRNVTYAATEKQIAALIDVSDSCVQKIKYGCFTAPLAGLGDVNYAWWVDRRGGTNHYWSGLHTGDHTCACGLANNCTSRSDLKCNCDASVPEYFVDEGVLTDSRVLPVQRIFFGGLKYPSQQANFTLGNLECSGKKALPNPSESCDTLRKSGHLASGNYILKTPATAGLSMGRTSSKDVLLTLAECNMNLGAEDPDFQVDLDLLFGWESRIRQQNVAVTKPSFPGTLQTPVIFDAYITKDITLTAHKRLAYDAFAVNLGGGMDLDSGVFSAPSAGVYMFTFSGMDRDVTGAHVSVRKNGAIIARAYEGSRDWGSVSLATMVNLAVGDVVDTTLHGTLGSNAERWVHFTGHLLAPSH